MSGLEPVLDASGLAVRYGSVLALHPMSLQVPRGGLLLILGPNGAGKSSLLRALAGLEPVPAASIKLDGREMARLSPQRRLREGIALVPEGRGRLPGLSVKDNLYLAWHAAPAARRASRDEAVSAVLDLFPILRQRFDQESSTLSGGEMQMLAIGRALVSKPSLLLLDEPSLGLAPMATAHVYAALSELSSSGLTMVVVEQKAVPLPSAHESTIVLRNGTVVFSEARRPKSDELAALYLGGRAA